MNQPSYDFQPHSLTLQLRLIYLPYRRLKKDVLSQLPSKRRQVVCHIQDHFISVFLNEVLFEAFPIFVL